MLDIQFHIFTHEYRLSNSIQHYYLLLNLEYRMSNTALKELGPFLFDMIIPGIHMEQGLHNKIIKKVYTINNGRTTKNL